MATENLRPEMRFPPKCATIEVHVAELKQLFNSIGPSRFREKDQSTN